MAIAWPLSRFHTLVQMGSFYHSGMKSKNDTVILTWYVVIRTTESKLSESAKLKIKINIQNFNIVLSCF